MKRKAVGSTTDQSFVINRGGAGYPHVSKRPPWEPVHSMSKICVSMRFPPANGMLLSFISSNDGYMWLNNVIVSGRGAQRAVSLVVKRGRVRPFAPPMKLIKGSPNCLGIGAGAAAGAAEFRRRAPRDAW